jgi:hypothetical protein
VLELCAVPHCKETVVTIGPARLTEVTLIIICTGSVRVQTKPNLPLKVIDVEL